MKIIAIILNYKTPKMTLEAASAALKELDRINGDWKLIIVDNDSQDESFERIVCAVHDRMGSGIENWDRVEILRSSYNGGFGAGNNFGIRQYISSDQSPDYFYILNSDAFPEKDSVRHLVDYLDSHSRTGIVGSYLHDPDGEPHVSAFRFPSILGEFEGSVRFGLLTKLLRKWVVPIGIPNQNVTVDWLAGASMMIRRELLEDVGLFDEDYFLYFEETDLCYRANKAGWPTVYVRKSSVTHIGGASTGMENWKRVPTYWMDSRRLFFTKNYGIINYCTATLVRIVGELIWRLRIKIEKKRDVNPGRFVGDLTKHFLSRCPINIKRQQKIGSH